VGAVKVVGVVNVFEVVGVVEVLGVVWVVGIPLVFLAVLFPLDAISTHFIISSLC
jgi:hypothetical protein